MMEFNLTAFMFCLLNIGIASLVIFAIVSYMKSRHS